MWRRVKHGKPRLKTRCKVAEKRPRKIKHLTKGKVLRLHVSLLFVLKQKLGLKSSRTGKCVLLEIFVVLHVCYVFVDVGGPVCTFKDILSDILKSLVNTNGLCTTHKTFRVFSYLHILVHFNWTLVHLSPLVHFFWTVITLTHSNHTRVQTKTTAMSLFKQGGLSPDPNEL